MLYKTIDVWKRSDGVAVRYRCFELIPGGQFCVQSADFYPLSSDRAKDYFLERQLAELFLEQAPNDRSGTFETLEEAIAFHDREFGSE
jgi:hypothetical protein